SSSRLTRRRPRSTLLPYTTLFRSEDEVDEAIGIAGGLTQRAAGGVAEHGHGPGPVPLDAGIGLDVEQAVVGQEGAVAAYQGAAGAEEHTSVVRSRGDVVCRLLGGE